MAELSCSNIEERKEEKEEVDRTNSMKKGLFFVSCSNIKEMKEEGEEVDKTNSMKKCLFFVIFVRQKNRSSSKAPDNPIKV
ncbi:unnamed protein product [Camellia sinensis]